MYRRVGPIISYDDKFEAWPSAAVIILREHRQVGRGRNQCISPILVENATIGCVKDLCGIHKIFTGGIFANWVSCSLDHMENMDRFE